MIKLIIYSLFNYSTTFYRLDMCRRNYPTDVCNRGTAGKCDFIASTIIITAIVQLFSLPQEPVTKLESFSV